MVVSYRFSLPRPTDILGLPIGQHISIAATLPGQDREVVRSYTPISSDENPGYFDLLLKSYPTGNISKYMATLKVGQVVKVKGPRGAMVYRPNLVGRLGMIAGGTGITPMLQIIRAVIRNRPRLGGVDRTRIDLVFANVNREDILLKEDLDLLAQEDSDFHIFYVLNNPPEKWDGGVGFVTPDIIQVSGRWRGLVMPARPFAADSNHAGVHAWARTGHEATDLRSPADGERHEEGDAVVGLRSGQSCQQVGGSSLLLLNTASTRLVGHPSPLSPFRQRRWIRGKTLGTFYHMPDLIIVTGRRASNLHPPMDECHDHRIHEVRLDLVMPPPLNTIDPSVPLSSRESQDGSLSLSLSFFYFLSLGVCLLLVS